MPFSNLLRGFSKHYAAGHHQEPEPWSRLRSGELHRDYARPLLGSVYIGRIRMLAMVQLALGASAIGD